MKDITGQRFGKLTALYRTDKKQGSSYKWHCHCDCGNEIDIAICHLTTGQSTSCGCNRAKDITGKRFGRLTAVERTNGRTSDGSFIWHCRCDCGNEIDVPLVRLRTGLTKSCGCIRNDGIDLTGRRYGGLVVLERSGYDSDCKPLWRCRCDCGNEVDILGAKLTMLRVRSCGCRNARSPVSRPGSGAHRKDLSGQKFGMLTVINYLPEKEKYHCRCECGTEIDVTQRYLKSSKNPSCGCVNHRSHGSIVRNWDKTEARLTKK